MLNRGNLRDIGRVPKGVVEARSILADFQAAARPTGTAT
jgi:hypothetical protein